MALVVRATTLTRYIGIESMRSTWLFWPGRTCAVAGAIHKPSVATAPAIILGICIGTPSFLEDNLQFGYHFLFLFPCNAIGRARGKFYSARKGACAQTRRSKPRPRMPSMIWLRIAP